MELADLRLIVEGIADQKFLTDYISYQFGIELEDDHFVRIGGNDDQKLSSKSSVLQLNEEGRNLVIFDADNDFLGNKQRYSNFFSKLVQSYQIFLFPNNNNGGNLENLLLSIINPKHQDIIDCLESYARCLGDQKKGYKTPPLKTKVFAYLDVQLSPKQEKFAKEEKRNYKNREHWNLDHEALEPLKEFLKTVFTDGQ